MTLDYLPDGYNPSTFILDQDVKTTRQKQRTRPGLYLPMDRATMSKASIVHTKSGCRDWQEFFQKLYTHRDAITRILKEELK